MNEQTAAAIFATAIHNKQAGQLLDHLFNGGGVMLDPDPPSGPRPGLVLIPADEIARIASIARGD